MSLRNFTYSASVLALAVLALAPGRAAAQTTPADSTLVDRVVAVVGDSVVLLSQIEEQVAELKLRGRPVPTDPDQLKAFEKNILESNIDRLLILQAAAKDTLVKLDESRVTQAADQQIENTTQSMGGADAMQQALQREGLTAAQYRSYITSQVRQEQIYQMYLQRQLQDAPPVEVTDAELHDAFQRESAQLQQRPKYMKFHQVVIAPQASDTAKANAKAFAESLLKRIRDGADFQELAKRYSDDPGSAPLGGDLGWFRRGHMVKAFEDAAFSLPPGQVSNVVETEFGYHIIKVERARPGERKARHILITPKIHPGDVTRAKSLAQEVVVKARADSSMDELATEYGDPLSPDSLAVAYSQIDSLAPAYGALRTATQGQVIGPLEFNSSSSGSASGTRFAIVKVDEIHEAGAYTFDEVKSQIAQQLEQQKQIDRLLKALRAKTYIDIRM
jgi:peptidyl-prolyl cis-trans isomerase SurA